MTGETIREYTDKQVSKQTKLGPVAQGCDPSTRHQAEVRTGETTQCLSVVQHPQRT